MLHDASSMPSMQTVTCVAACVTGMLYMAALQAMAAQYCLQIAPRPYWLLFKRLLGMSLQAHLGHML